MTRGLTWQTRRSKKNLHIRDTKYTQSAPNYRDHPKPDSATTGVKPSVCLPERHPYPSADPARRPRHVTYRFPESRGGFCRRTGRKAGFPSYSQNPTSAHTCCHRVSIQRMGAALQQLMSRAPSAAKASPARTAPHSLGGNQCTHQPTRMTYHAYHAYHAPFPSDASLGNFRNS